jgi:hypothetical protein
MRLIAILLGAGLLFAAPVADTGLRFLSGRAALAAFDRMRAANDGISAGQISFDPSFDSSFDPWRGTLRVDNLVLRAQALTIRIGHLTYARKAGGSWLVSAALAQQNDAKTHDLSSAILDAARTAAQAGTISAEDIVIESADATYKIPRIEVAGTDLDEDELAALFDAKNSAPIGERFAQISAARITIPEVTAQFKNSPTTGEFVYRDIELGNVVKSHAAQATMKSLSANLVAQESATIKATCGPTRMNDFDIAQNLKLMSETAKTAEERKPLYSSLTVETCKITSDSESKSGRVQMVLEIGAIAASDVKGRPPMQSLASAKELFDVNRQDADAPDLLAKRNAYLSDIYASYEAGSVEMADLRITGTVSEAAAFSGSLGKVSLARFAASRIDELRFDDMALDTGGSKVKLAGFALRGINFANIIKFMDNKTEDRAGPLPVLDQVLVEKLDVDVVDSKTDANAHTRFQLAKFDMSGTNSIGGIPTRFAMGLEHFIVDLASLNSAEVADAVALGYDKLDLSSRLEMNFNAAKQELSVEDFSLIGKDMGVVKLSGQLSKVGQDLFSRDQSVAEAALLATLINRLEIRIENAGLFEKIIAAAAKKEGKSPDEIRRGYVAAASVNVPLMLDNGPGAKLIGAALAKFVAAPKNFHLIARAPNGLGASDLTLIKEPGALMQQLEIEATANE